MNTTMKKALAATVAGAMIVATPSLAAPVLRHSTAVTAAVATDVIDVRYRGRGGRSRGFVPGAAVAIGALGIIGAVAAGAAQDNGAYYGYESYPAYGSGYAPAYGPGYAPAYGPGYGRYPYSECYREQNLAGAC
jgi:hypothetical protein